MEHDRAFPVKKFIILSTSGFFFCLLTGFLIFQMSVFNIYSMAIQFIVYGLPGAIIFSALRYAGMKESILYTAAAIFLEMILMKTTSLMFIMRDICFFASLWTALFLYQTQFIPRSKKTRRFRAVGLGVILGLTNIAAGLVLFTVHYFVSGSSYSHIHMLLYMFMKYGMLIGLGLGIGFDVGDEVIKKKLV